MAILAIIANIIGAISEPLGVVAPSDPAVLLETGDYLLLESGDRLLLE